jgi:hypothetical protein
MDGITLNEPCAARGMFWLKASVIRGVGSRAFVTTPDIYLITK